MNEGTRRKAKPHITLITHRCPKGHEWKSMMVKAHNCPTCRKERIKAGGDGREPAPEVAEE